jgi:hypothetical protein
MKLSTFLLLLDGKAWFPSVASLRAGDPLEAALGDEFYDLIWNRLELEGASDAIQWLACRREWPDGHPYNDPGPICSPVYGKALADEIARLRAVWCWFRSSVESAAMWSVYGHQGVAVMTDRHRLREALPHEKEFRIDDMTYVDRRGSAERNINRIIGQQPDLILRPHFLKAVEYQHEQEVRVAGHCPVGAKGVMVSGIRPEMLIREVMISPLLPPAEAAAIEGIIAQRFKNLSFSVNRSSLSAETDGAIFAESITEGLYGETDDHMDTNLLPPAFQTL